MTGSMSVIAKSLLITTLVTGSRASDDGDDFSNNLFSDLAPLLALFGERVTMQFMSQSEGWADNIILAMAPIGIITTIVASIRVGGPPWLKAVIGRARENLAVSEVEFMSSTSKEVCEVWNGQEVVRCMGLAPVIEFICLLQFADAGQSDNQPNPTIEVLKLEEAIAKGYIKDLANRRELWLFAAFGTFLQLGVLTYSGFATYHPALKFQKDKKPIESYAYPCTAISTLVLVLGMMLCGHVVESSTDEKRYQAVAGWKTRMVWLQQTKTVSDQVFNSHMMYAKDDRQTITTSRRSNRHGKDKSNTTRTGSTAPGGDDPSTFLNVVTITGTGITLCGVVIQFFGLRGMHWSASIAQLGAILVMVCVKAWVRRGLAKSPEREPLPSGFELDLFTTSLGGIATEAWSGGQGNDNVSVNTRLPGGAKTPRNEWRVVTGRSSALNVSKFNHVSAAEPCDGSIFDAQALLDARKSLAHLAGWKGPASAEAVSLARAIECTLDADLETRYSGAKEQRISIPLSSQVTGWKVDASLIEAILSLWLSTAEEKDSSQDKDTLSSITNGIKHQKPKSQDDWLRSKGTMTKHSLRLVGRCTPSLVRDLLWWIHRDLLSVFEIQERQVGSLRATLQMDKHRVVGYTQQDDGSEPHSLQLQYLDRDNSGFNDDGNTFISDTDSDGDDDEDISANGNNGNYAWDVADDASDQSFHGYVSSDDDIEHPNDHDRQCGTGTITMLGNESYQSLRALYAIDLFSSFTRAMAKAMNTPIPGGAEQIQSKSDTGDAIWTIFTLRNNHLSNLIQDIHSTGLGSLDQIYLSVITPLSQENVLPQLDAVVNLALQRSRRHERSQKWKEAGNDLVWLFRLANRTFSSGDNIVAKATANLMEYERLISRVLRISMERNFEPYDMVGTRDLKRLLKRLQQELEAADPDLKELLWKKYKILRPLSRQCLTFEASEASVQLQNPGGSLSDQTDILERTALHYYVFVRIPIKFHNCMRGQHEVNAQDLLARTALHYMCLHDAGRLDVAQWLLDYGADPSMTARDGSTPLHYAAMRGDEKKTRMLIEAGSTVDTSDLAGRSPLHTAAVNGHAAVMEYLWDKSRPERRDRWGWTVLHLAAISGSRSVMELLFKLNCDKDARDRCGRTALNLAVLAGKEAMVTFLIDEGFDTKAKDNSSSDVFDHAVIAGKVGMFQLLINRGLGKECNGMEFSDPLAVSLRYGHEAVTRLLISSGINYNWKDLSERNLRHYASMAPTNTTLMQEFIDAGCDISSRDDFGDSPLHFTIYSSIASNVKFLIERGANIDQTNNLGHTALWEAISRGKVRHVQMLLDNGASLDVISVDHNPKTLVSMALRLANKKIIDLIRRHQAKPRSVSQDVSQAPI
ncbi:unnamed protein product [Fusarium graminearum]|nr:unnamed protein product [Fusarium graminearum]